MSTSDLPKVHVRIEKPPCKDCKCYIQEEDRKLKQWKTWMDIRKETHKKIIARTGRESGDMLMNSTEDIHETNENRLIIQYTNVSNKPDKYRGCPNFFNLPNSLFEEYWKKSPAYFTILTKEEQCIVPEIEYIRTGDVIKKEKGISSTTTKSKLAFLKSKYLQQRRKDLQDKLLEIEPHKPIGDFTIIGTAILKQEDTNLPLNDLPPESSFLDYVSPPLERFLPIIKINGETIYNKSVGRKIINVNIDFDVSSNDVRLDYFTITNYSSKALRFSWRKVKICHHFENYNMLYVVKQQSFFFNLNQFVVIPQETKQVPIYFKSKSEGLYNELWKLIIVPDLWQNNLKVQVKLNCVAVIKSFEVRSAIIKEHLQNRVRERIIDESLRKILATVPEKKAEYTVYSYDKATLFEAINSSFSPINLRPKYIYNKSIVGELEAFYNAIKFDHHPAVWNLNLNTLRQYTKEREMHDKELQLQEQHRLLLEKIWKAEGIRSTREDLRHKLLNESNVIAKSGTSKAGGTKGGKKSPKKAATTKGKDKKGNKKSVLEKAAIIVPLVKRHDIPTTLSQQLEDIVKKLHQPITWANEQQQKLTMAYALFCAYFDKIQSEVAILNINFNTDIHTTYPYLAEFTPPLPLRMISEYHDETMMQVEMFRETCGTMYDKQAEPWVREVPIEDYQTRYRAFHYIVEDPKVVKKTGKNKKESKKGSKKDKSSTKSKLSPAKSDKVKECPHLTVIQYDPYAEVIVKVPKSNLITTNGSNSNYETPDLKATDVQLYKNNLYTIFYMNLCRAVDDLEAFLLLQSKLSVKHNIIQKVTDGFTVQTLNEPETIKIIDLRRAISESLNSKESPTENHPRPCYRPLIMAETIDTTASDSSLWDILQKPKVPTKPLQPGEYEIVKGSGTVETQDTSTSVRHLDDDDYSVLEYLDANVQVETYELSRNIDCDLYCECAAEEHVCKLTTSKLRLKVKTASECFYPDLIIDGTQNFKFYVDSDDEEDVPKEEQVPKEEETPQEEEALQKAETPKEEEALQKAEALKEEEAL